MNETQQMAIIISVPIAIVEPKTILCFGTDVGKGGLDWCFLSENLIKKRHIWD